MFCGTQWPSNSDQTCCKESSAIVPSNIFSPSREDAELLAPELLDSLLDSELLELLEAELDSDELELLGLLDSHKLRI
jgi:hypothetical protein